MHIKAFLAAGAFHRVLALFNRQTECGTAVFTLAVAANLTVTELVTLISKKVFDLVPYCKKLSVFLTALVNIL